jgi:hypothetical protein
VVLVPADRDGQAGEGLLLAVRKGQQVRVQDWASDDTSLWVKLTFSGSPSPLFIGVCYLPPAGSPQLRDDGVADRLATMGAHVAAACQAGDVLLGGDFNARVGTGDDGGGPRGATDLVVTAHGHLLLDFCRRHGLLLCSGRVNGDALAVPTFQARQNTQASRPDHVLASSSFFSKVVSSGVNMARYDSDHWPIEVALDIPASPVTPAPCQGVDLPRVHWLPAGRGAYARALGDVADGVLEACSQAAARADVSAAFDLLDGAVRQAARVAGMRGGAGGRRLPLGRDHQPFFDKECLRLKRGVRACLRWGGSRQEARVLERQYHSVVRSKRRAHRRRELQALLADQRGDPRRFWKRLRSMRRDVPPQLRPVQCWDSYVRRVGNLGLPDGCTLPGEAFPQHGDMVAAELNAPITLEEVMRGLKQLNNGRATGRLGLPAELLRYAQAPPTGDVPRPPHLLAPMLLEALNAAFRSGQVPARFNTGLVTPVYKRGDACEPGNYRPIAVTEPIMRLYAGILNRRLVQFTEQHRLRAPTQAGFRPGLSTLHQLFTLQHFVDRACHASAPLYCCFLDLEGAFDRVPRSLLWQALRRLGVHGAMLRAIQSLYDGATVAVNIGGRMGASVPSETGVKQGCPLSPTLFGLFLDGLHRYLVHHCPDVGPALHGGLRVPDLAYADDVGLLSTELAGLQRLIDAADTFSAQVGMRISAQKTFMMVFGATVEDVVCTCGGQPLRCVDTGKYLGVQLGAMTGVGNTCSLLRNKMLAAWAMLRRQFAGLHCATSLDLMLQVYQTCVPPVASYACELWGHRPLPAPLKADRTGLDQTHALILRRIAGLRRTVPAAIVYAEVGGASLTRLWWVRLVRFWNALARLPATSLHRLVAIDDCRDAVLHKIKNWAHAFMRELRDLGYAFTIRCDTMEVVDLGRVKQLLDQRASQVWQGLDVCPRTCPSPRAQLCTYARWFARPAGVPSARCPARLPLSAGTLRTFLRFRAGCHNLPNDVGRRTGVPRSQRFCGKCHAQVIADERHLIFECSVVQPIRNRYPSLFTGPGQTMQQFMWQADIAGVVHFIRDSILVLLGPDPEGGDGANLALSPQP